MLISYAYSLYVFKIYTQLSQNDILSSKIGFKSSQIDKTQSQVVHHNYALICSSSQTRRLNILNDDTALERVSWHDTSDEINTKPGILAWIEFESELSVQASRYSLRTRANNNNY